MNKNRESNHENISKSCSFTPEGGKKCHTTGGVGLNFTPPSIKTLEGLPLENASKVRLEKKCVREVDANHFLEMFP